MLWRRLQFLCSTVRRVGRGLGPRSCSGGGLCSSRPIPSCLSEVLGLGLAMSGKRCGALRGAGHLVRVAEFDACLASVNVYTSLTYPIWDRLVQHLVPYKN